MVKSKILILDNYDSFTYNLTHLVELFSDNYEVIRNDRISVREAGKYDKILLSPGPGLPSEAGVMPEIIKKYAPSVSILGVCLGMQGIVECFGGKLKNLPKVKHGVTSEMVITQPEDNLFVNVPEKVTIGHYHSWVADEQTLPEDLKVTALNADGLIMAVAHKKYDVKGVQFHPESVMTAYGQTMIGNWVKR